MQDYPNTTFNRIRSNTTLTNLNDWGYQNRPKGIQIDKNNFNLFLEKIKNIIKYVKNIEITELHLKELNNILDITIKKNINIHCPKPGELLIKGDYIKFSDFIDTKGNVKDVCGNGIAITSVDIFSVNTIFIDRNFRGLESQVSIAATKWLIIGTRTINLNGASATAYESKVAKDIYNGRHGSDGLPGLPGLAGGNFLGIGKEFINGKYLTITANGGQGGDGQMGADGKPGINGESATTYGDFRRELYDHDTFIIRLSVTISLLVNLVLLVEMEGTVVLQDLGV